MKQSEIQQNLPKVELHAHLNGSIPLATLQTLADERGVVLSEKFLSCVLQPDTIAKRRPPRTLQDCFDLFGELPPIINDLTALREITRAALKLFADHHVAYLELRTTPKRLMRNFKDPGVGYATKLDYLEAVLSEMELFSEAEESRYEAMQSSSDARLPLICQLIVAVDRSLSFSEGQENIDLAIQLHSEKKGVVGVDLGGNPTKQSFQTFEPLFSRARENGLKVTIHCAEIPDCEDEVNDILVFRPDRLGHAVLLPDPHSLDALQIPVETCPTSNVMTLELFGHADEHDTIGALRSQHTMLRMWLATDYPIVINTDDPGIFETTPTKELWVVQEAFGCNLPAIMGKAVDYAFCDDETKDRLRSRIEPRISLLRQSHIQ